MVSFATRIRVMNEDLWNGLIFVHIQGTVFEVKLLISPKQVNDFVHDTNLCHEQRSLGNATFIHIHWGRFSEPILHARKRKIEGENWILEKYKTLWKERNESTNICLFKLFLSFWLKCWENFFEIRKKNANWKKAEKIFWKFWWSLICLTILNQICET